MKEILSNQSVAQRVAKELENALESIHNIKSIMQSRQQSGLTREQKK